MAVVDQRVFDSSFGQRRGQLRLPHAFRKPRADRPLAKLIFNKAAQPVNLLDSILERNRYQNRFVKSSAHDFHLAARHQRTNPLQIFGMLFGHPFEQRTGIVQP